MVIDKIKELAIIDDNRNSSTGYKTNPITINSKRLQYLTLAGRYDNKRFDKFFKQAILERGEELLARAIEIEELYYQEVTKDAKIQAASILIGEDLELKTKP